MEKKPRAPIAHLLETQAKPLTLVSSLLEQTGFQVQKREGVSALIENWVNQYVRMPSVIMARVADGGLCLARLLLENQSLPNSSVVLLDDRADVTAAIGAIRYGAKDYILLDAPSYEIKARIEHVWRRLYVRHSQSSANDILSPRLASGLDLSGDDDVGVGDGDGDGDTNQAKGGAITWDASLNAVRRGDTWISLSPIEWRLFYTLINKRGTVVPLEDLVSNGLQRDATNNADVPLLRLHISRLRSKLNENFGQELNVVTLRGRGYMLV